MYIEHITLTIENSPFSQKNYFFLGPVRVHIGNLRYTIHRHISQWWVTRLHDLGDECRQYK